MRKTIYAAAVLAAIFLIITFSMKGQEKNGELAIGDRIPDFTLLDQDGNSFKASDYIGKKAMVIYFYPKDDTPGCTREACTFRDKYQDFSENDVIVVGISSDSVESHRNFAEKYNLPFTLLSDEDQEVRQLFGVKKSLLGLFPGRETFVVDKQGNVVFRFNSQLKVERHVEQALNALDIED